MHLDLVCFRPGSVIRRIKKTPPKRGLVFAKKDTGAFGMLATEQLFRYLSQ